MEGGKRSERWGEVEGGMGVHMIMIDWLYVCNRQRILKDYSSSLKKIKFQMTGLSFNSHFSPSISSPKTGLDYPEPID